LEERSLTSQLNFKCFLPATESFNWNHTSPVRVWPVRICTLPRANGLSIHACLSGDS